MRRAENAAEASEMMGHSDGGAILKSTLEAYTEAANGKRPDDFGKTVFPAKDFDPAKPFREFRSNVLLHPCTHNTFTWTRCGKREDLGRRSKKGRQKSVGLLGAARGYPGNRGNSKTTEVKGEAQGPEGLDMNYRRVFLLCRV